MDWLEMAIVVLTIYAAGMAAGWVLARRVMKQQRESQDKEEFRLMLRKFGDMMEAIGKAL